MKLKISRGFLEKLEKQISFIAKDKSAAARKFKNELLDRIKEIPGMPIKTRSLFYLTGMISGIWFYSET
jgi:plasmid stabilization system protein ParE